MRYLLLTHIPAFAGQSPGVIRWPTEWATDLAVQTSALRQAGFKVTVASPLQQTIDAQTLRKQTLVDVRTDDGFRYLPLPGYRTMSQFVAARPAIRRLCLEAAQDADIVQTGPGGHPVSLGQTVWADLAKTPVKRLLTFWSDPIPALQRYSASGRNPAKRLAKSLVARQLETFCAKAIATADLVIAHHDSVRQRFAKAWGAHCHTLFTTGLADATVAARTPDNRRALRVLCFGDVAGTQGIDHLIRAFAKARRLSARIELDLTGDLIGSADVTNLIRDEKIEAVVRLHGKITPTARMALLDQADLFMRATLIPGSDPIIYLAAARGLPMVTYQSGDFDQFLLESGAARVVPRGEMNILAQTLLDLARDRPQLGAMSARAIEWSRSVSLDAIHRRRAELARTCVNEQ